MAAEQLLTWEHLAELHARAAEAANRIPFPQHRFLGAPEFADLCKRAGLGTHLGSSLETLEDLHRLRLVVPLLKSPKGSNNWEVAPFTWYEPWDTFGNSSSEGGWTEIFYHPFQLWAVDIAARWFFLPYGLSPAFREAIVDGSYKYEHLAKSMGHEVVAASNPLLRQRLARFYMVMPALVFADATVGPHLRRLLHGITDNLERRRSAAGRRLYARQVNRLDATRYRWSRRMLLRYGPALLAERRQDILQFARDVWMLADSIDPLREWEDLIPFVRWDERERLHGKAFGAHRLKELAQLLGELVARVDPSATAQDVFDPAGERWTRKRLGSAMDPSDLSQKSIVTSRYGLNPSPTVSWFVEGDSEQRVIMAISAARGRPLESCGVVVNSLDGGDNLKHLELALDSAQKLGTLVFVLADTDGRKVAKWVGRLLRAGRLSRDRVFWSQPNLETANFTQDELMQAEAAVPSGKKPDRAAWITERFVLPHLSNPSPPHPRLIVDQMQSVLDAARRHDYSRPRLHEGVWAGGPDFPGVSPSVDP